MDDRNILLMTDSYKLSHYKQYPPKTEQVYSYFESRNGAKYLDTLFFGAQYLVRKHLCGQVVTKERIDAANNLANIHMGGTDGCFNREGWQYILDRHNGKLPVRIRTVPEGMRVKQSNVLMTIENTDPNCYWLPNYLETLLVQSWYPSTVATVSAHVRDIIKRGLEKSGDVNGLPFKLHDFGFRGASSVESAGIGGLAHLVNFDGTDTLAALTCGINYYDSGVCGFSIPASEHSTITSWGAEYEVNAFRNMLEKYPTGLVACVSDSFDIGRACTEYWGNTLKEEVLNRDGCLVVRPDSGDIVDTVKDTLRRLGNAFGTYTNDKGYRVLNDRVRVIQGDGCTPETIERVVDNLLTLNWSLDNIAFGMGGGLLQKVDRDTQRFAFKCSEAVVDGEPRDVFKHPKTDPTKASKRGRLKLVETNAGFQTRAANDEGTDQLVTTYENGEMRRIWTFDEVRQRARQ